MAKSYHNRRAMLGAIAIAPFAIHAPAVAAEPSRHAVWLSEHNATLALANTLPENDKAEALYARLNELERLLTKTPAKSLAEAKDKLRFALVVHENGFCLDGDDAGDLIADIAPYLL